MPVKAEVCACFGSLEAGFVLHLSALRGRVENDLRVSEIEIWRGGQHGGRHDS
jgi:hypothetical protein